MTAQSRYNKFKTKYEEARKEMSALAQGAFKEAFQDFFNTHPKVESVGWAQYTPYFADGDECIFRVCTYSDSLSINGIEIYPELEDIEDAGFTKAEYDFITEDAADLLSNFDDDILKDLYGDHAKVTVKRDGTAEVDEYNHD